MSFSSSIVPQKSASLSRCHPLTWTLRSLRFGFTRPSVPCEGHYSFATGLIPDHATQTDSHNDRLRNVEIDGAERRSCAQQHWRDADSVLPTGGRCEPRECQRFELWICRTMGRHVSRSLRTKSASSCNDIWRVKVPSSSYFFCNSGRA